MKKIVCIALAGTVLLSCQNQEESKGEISQVKPTYTIDPPIEEMTPDEEVFEVDCTKDTVLISDHGSFVSIPAHAFVDQAGVPVEKVQVELVEYSNPADILLSGIPMNCADENGEVQTFQSAGMINLNATAEGKPVQIADDKSLSLGLRNKAQDEDYNLYYFDETIGEWQEREKNVPVAAVPIPVKPIAVEQADTNKVINITVLNKSMRPAYQMWDQSKFLLVDGQEPKYNSEAVFWYDMQVLPTSNQDEYVLKFYGRKYNERRVEALLVQPLVSSSNYDNEMAAFEERMRGFARALLENDIKIENDRKSGAEMLKLIEEEEAKMRIEDSLMLVEAEENWIRDSIANANFEASKVVRSDVMRTFEINNLGLFNCDRFYKRPITKELDLDFVQGGTKVPLNYGALCSPRDNAVLTYIPNTNGTYHLSMSTGEFIFIGVAGTQILAAELNLSTPSGTCEMKEISQEMLQHMMTL